MSDDNDERDEGRRAFLRLAGAIGGGAALAVAGCKSDPQKSAPQPVATPALAASANPTDPNVVRVVSVPTAVEGEVLPTLIAEFHKHSGPLRVRLTTSNDLYDIARRGEADLAISHYGHKHAEAFVMDGFGEWPRTLFSNQMVLLGPTSDPAKIRGLEDAGEAFRRIAAAKGAVRAERHRWRSLPHRDPVERSGSTRAHRMVPG